jgi:hypothetical protein
MHLDGDTFGGANGTYWSMLDNGNQMIHQVLGSTGSIWMPGGSGNFTIKVTNPAVTAFTIGSGANVQFNAYTAGASVFDGSGNISSVAPGTSGNVLTSNGTTWTSAAPSGGGANTALSNLTTTSVNETLNMAATKTLVLKNNVALIGRNAGDTGDVPMIRTAGGDGSVYIGNDAGGFSFIQVDESFMNIAVQSGGVIDGGIDINTEYINLFGDSVGGTPVDLIFWAGDQNETITLKAPLTIAASYTLTLPVDDGTSGQFLQTNGAGVLSWASGANTALSNLTTTSINQNLIPDSDFNREIGSSTAAWLLAYVDRIFGGGPTPADINFNGGGEIRLTSTVTGTGSAIALRTGGTDAAAGISYDTNYAGVAVDTNTGGQSWSTGDATGTGQTGGYEFNIGQPANGNQGDFEISAPAPSGSGVQGSFIITEINKIMVPQTITAGGVTGNQTIHKVSGTVNFAAAATSLVVTNNRVTANSIVLAVIRTNDATMTSVQVVPTSGSFTIYANAAATAETSVGFFVLN